MEWMVLKMVLSLGAVLLLMFGLVVLLKRFALPGAAGTRLQLPIDVIGRRALQPKKSVVVLKVAGKILVIGLSEHGLQTLAELQEQDLPVTEREGAAPGMTRESGSLFASTLQGAFRSLTKRNGAGVNA